MKQTLIVASAVALALVVLIETSAAPPANDSSISSCVWFVSTALFISLPPIAIVADRRAKANRKSRNLPTLALLCWVAELVAGFVYIGSGAWYCETCAGRPDYSAWPVFFAVALPWAAACYGFVLNPKAR